MGDNGWTKWWIAHPWHVTKGARVPKTCDCGCQKKETK